jgi:hypothetical protein
MSHRHEICLRGMSYVSEARDMSQRHAICLRGMRYVSEARDMSPLQTFRRLWGLPSPLFTIGVFTSRLKQSEHKADNNPSNFENKNE